MTQKAKDKHRWNHTRTLNTPEAPQPKQPRRKNVCSCCGGIGCMCCNYVEVKDRQNGKVR